MHKYVAYENTFLDLGAADLATLDSILRISQEIKKNLGLSYSPIHIEADSKVYIERIVGNISHGDVNLIILPKVPAAPNSAEKTAHEIIRDFMLRTLRCVGTRLDSTVYFTKSSLVDDQGLFLETIAKYYIETLTKAVRITAVATYQTYEAKVPSVKGRIMVHKQLSEPITDAKIWCRYKRMSEDNAINALLVWACQYLSESVKDLFLRKKLLLLIQDFGPVHQKLSYQIVSSLELPRQFTAFRESFLIAKNLYLSKSRKKETVGSNHVCGYIISTERAFERIVETHCGEAARRLGYAHRAQAEKQLAESTTSGNKDFYVIPDDLVFTSEKKLVIDAKYKLLKQDHGTGKPGRDDFYQMISSCIAHNAFESVLIYPKDSGSQANSWSLTQQINGENYIIHSAFVDIFGSDKDITEELINTIKATKFHGVTQ